MKYEIYYLLVIIMVIKWDKLSDITNNIQNINPINSTQLLCMKNNLHKNSIIGSELFIDDSYIITLSNDDK